MADEIRAKTRMNVLSLTGLSNDGFLLCRISTDLDVIHRDGGGLEEKRGEKSRRPMRGRNSSGRDFTRLFHARTDDSHHLSNRKPEMLRNIFDYIHA